jgi:Mrp family chromosome partitioning ATPase
MESEVDLRYMIAEHDKPLKGLGEWLSYDVLSPEEMIWPTILAGVECIPRLEAAVSPDLLSSMRMKELMETLSENFSFIIVDGPPVGTLVDAELIAQCCDAMIFVVRSRSCVSSVLKKSVERMRGTGTPVAGFIVNYIDPLYLKWT